MTEIGKHIATLNLFLEADGSFEITVASASAQFLATQQSDLLPIYVIEEKILMAAENMRLRHAHPRKFAGGGGGSRIDTNHKSVGAGSPVDTGHKSVGAGSPPDVEE